MPLEGAKLCVCCTPTGMEAIAARVGAWAIVVGRVIPFLDVFIFTGLPPHAVPSRDIALWATSGVLNSMKANLVGWLESPAILTKLGITPRRCWKNCPNTCSFTSWLDRLPI